MMNKEERVLAYLRCGDCDKRYEGCEELCDKRKMYLESFNVALNIIDDPSLGIPRGGDCIDCENRTLTCHASCESYLVFKMYRDLRSEMIRKAKQREHLGRTSTISFERTRRSTKWRYT